MTPPVTAAAPATADQTLLLELSFPAAPDRLKVIRPALHAAALMCGFSELDARDIVLAVDEACQNIIVHAYPAADPGPGANIAPQNDIAITVLRRRDGILVRLRDTATPVDPSRIRPRDLDRVRPGGLGTHFIRQIMDRVDYLPGAAGNTLELLKHHRPAL